ncbi:hypothetical protein DL93DRAFT_506408 [Clavulina sp. PMI_390]|nr:hypothetical protein DL93DRAFT_506408 [Clavulina sp. PMI_390]
MAIELGLIAAVALAGAAVQLRVLSVLRVRLQELNEEHRRKDAELEQEAADRYKDVEAAREEWEKKHGHGSESASMSAPTVLNRVDSGLDTPTEEAPGTPRTVTVAGGRPVSSLVNFPYSSVNSGSDPSRPPQTAGALPALDLGTPVKDEIPRSMIDAPTILEDHHEIRERNRLANEIQEIRKSLGMTSSPPPEPRATRNSTGTSLSALGGAGLERAVATEAAMRAAEAELGRPIGGGAGPGGGLASARDRVRSMITMPTARRSSLLGESPAEPSSSSGGGAGAPVGARSPNVGTTGRPSSVPLADDDWQTYVQERKLFQPPSGVTAPIPTTPLPTRTVRSPPSEGVMAALANRQRRESMFDPTLPTVESAIDEAEEHPESSRAIDHRSSWISFKDQLVNAMFSSNSQRSPSPGPGPILPTAHSHTRTRSQPSLFHRRSNSTSTQLQQPQPQAPITVLPPARSPKSSQAAPPQQPSPPAERVLTYEEYNERHKARLHALQQPLTKQEKKDATLADARERWERSKATEARMMAKKQAEEAAAIEARAKEGGHRRRSSTLGLLDRRQSTGLPDSPNARSSFETEQSSQMPARPAAAASKAGPSKRSRPSEHRRNSLSLEALGARSSSRMSSNFKVEEWQKYQAATTAPPATSAGSSASDDVPLAQASPSRKSRTPEPRLTPDRS